MADRHLTSMLDVAFLLLIFFVLTATFVMDEGLLPSDLGGGQPATRPPESRLTMHVRSLGGQDVRIDLQPVGGSAGSQRQLYRKLKSLRFTESNPGGVLNPNDPLIIKPDENTSWQHVVGAYNTAVRAEYERITFARAGG